MNVLVDVHLFNSYYILDTGNSKMNETWYFPQREMESKSEKLQWFEG